jgi:hypothetical protein
MGNMTRSVSNVSIVVGVIELVAATVSAIIGVIAVTSYSGHPSASAGLWALVVSKCLFCRLHLGSMFA